MSYEIVYNLIDNVQGAMRSLLNQSATPQQNSAEDADATEITLKALNAAISDLDQPDIPYKDTMLELARTFGNAYTDTKYKNLLFSENKDDRTLVTGYLENLLHQFEQERESNFPKPTPRVAPHVKSTFSVSATGDNVSAILSNLGLNSSRITYSTQSEGVQTESDGPVINDHGVVTTRGARNVEVKFSDEKLVVAGADIEPDGIINGGTVTLNGTQLISKDGVVSLRDYGAHSKLAAKISGLQK
jgi:hypothetical protein